MHTYEKIRKKQEFIEGATRTFGMWWLSSLEGVRKRGR